MRDFVVSIPRDKRPLYLRITAALRDAIKSGLVQPGELLPSCRRLAVQIGANRLTVMTALDNLVAEGWVHAELRKGYRVALILPSRFSSGPVPTATKSVASAPRMVPKAPKLHWDFRSGRPDLRLFPFGELKASLAETMRRCTPALLDLGDPLGHPPFVRELKCYLRRVRALAGRELIVTHGSQEAIFITAQVLLQRGDVVAVESLSYPSARAALASTGAVLHPVAIDSEGLDPEDLAKLLKRRRIKLLYLTPLHQYPTTVTLSSPRRLAIYEMAVRNGVKILEDDYDHEYHYRCQPLPPMAADDPAGIVVYVSTLSKVLFPSSRIGFAVLPPGLLNDFAAVRRMTTTQNDALLQDAVARWMRNEGFQRHLNRTRRTYERRLCAAIAMLERQRAADLPLAWRPPDGGMAIWLDTPWDTTQLANAAAAAGILIQPEGPTRTDRGSGSHLRLGFAGHNEQEMAAGMARLIEIGRTL